MAHSYGTSARLPATATTTTANPATVTITCPAGTTVLWLGIVVSTTTARSGGDPTYNSVTMSAGAAKTNAGGTAETNAETWYLLRPPTGSSYTISIPNAGGLAMTISAACASAASGYTTVKSQSSVATQGNSTNPSTTGPTGAIGDIEFSVIGNGATTWNPSGRSGTQINDWDAGSRGHGAQYRVSAGTGGSTHSWTFATSEDWIIEVDRFTESAIVAPTVTTSDPTNVGQDTCTGNGNVTADGGGDITERGVCWGTSANPTTSNSKATTSGTTGTYTVDVTGLTPNTLYHFRAYAINSAGTSYGADVEATTDAYDKGWGVLPSIALVFEAGAPGVANAESATELSAPAATLTYAGTVAAATSATEASTVVLATGTGGMDPAPLPSLGLVFGIGLPTLVVTGASSATTASEPAATVTYAGAVAAAESATEASTVEAPGAIVYAQPPGPLPSLGLLLSPISNAWSATALSTPTGSQDYTQAAPQNLASATAASTLAGTLTGNGQVTLTWIASTDQIVTQPGGGYYLYWDTAPRGNDNYLLYANSRDVGNVTSYTLTGLTAGLTYYLNLSTHGPGGHDAFESGLVGEVSQVAIQPTAVMANAASATALSTPGATQLQRSTVAAAASATLTSQPTGTATTVGTVAGASSATLSGDIVGVHAQFGTVAGATSATLAATPAALMTYAGAPAAALSATAATAPLGRQVHTGTISDATSAVTAEATASIQINRGTAQPLASATSVDAVLGTIPNFGAIEAATSATLLDATGSTQDHQGAPADAASAITVDAPEGRVVIVAEPAAAESATAASEPAAVQLQEGGVIGATSATSVDAPTATTGYAGVVPGIESATAASAPDGTQDQTTPISEATSATALSEPAGVLVDIAAVADAASDTELFEPDCSQEHYGAVPDALSAVGASDVLGIQTHEGIVVGATSSGTLGLPSYVDDITSDTALGTSLGVQVSAIFTLIPRNARSRTYVRRPHICSRGAP